MKETRSLFVLCALCAFGVILSSPSRAEEQPRAAGTDVPVPRRVKTVPPEYPAEARARGLRGIVVLELIIDTQGRVTSASVVRSVPPFDDAALAAVRKWEYEVTRVDGKPVPVRLTLPITFAMKLPEMTRQEGIPELRAGAAPAVPEGGAGREGATVVAEVTLDAEGQVAEAEVKSGEPPWSQALLQALRTWRFSTAADQGVLSFRVQADFVPEKKGAPARVDLHLTGLRRSETLAAAEPSPAATPAPSPAPPAPAATAEPSPMPAPVATPATPASPVPAAPAAAEAARPGPPTEVITAPPPQSRPAAPASPGASALHGVALARGVPDLLKGRRPTTPPLARMGGVSGSVEVRFSVDAAGSASVLSVEGPDLLKPAAEQTVASWGFRRVSVERLYFLAVFEYGPNAATAVVKPAE